MKPKTKTYLKYGIALLLLSYLSLMLIDTWNMIKGENIFTMFELLRERYIEFDNPTDILINPIKIYFNTNNLKGLLLSHTIVTFVIGYLIYQEVEIPGEFHNEEKGSAEWGNDKYRKEKGLNQKEGNIILSQTEFLPINPKEIYRNANITVIGGSGSQKTRSVVKSNIMQANTSYIITDPAGDLYKECGGFLKKQGYEVKALNTKNPRYSAGFNPFKYTEEDKDIDMLAKAIKRNSLDRAKGTNTKGDFFEKAAEALLRSLLHYVNEEFDDDNPRKNLKTVLDLVLLGKQEDEGEQTELDKKMEQIRTKNTEHPALTAYDIFSLAPKKTRNSILITLGTQLSFLSSKEVQNLITKDTINLKNHNKKRAIFVIIPDDEAGYNTLTSLFFTQMFRVLYRQADNSDNGKLGTHHQCILDEFANIGRIPDFLKKISTMRKRGISAMPIVQDKSQLKAKYKESVGTLLGNCDTILYLGGTHQKTAEEISKRIGHTTVKSTEYSDRKSTNSGSYTRSTRKVKRRLMTPEEILELDDDKMIVTIRGFKPFKSKKHFPELHKNYDLLKDEDNHLDITEEYKEKGNLNTINNNYQFDKEKSTSSTNTDGKSSYEPERKETTNKKIDKDKNKSKVKQQETKGKEQLPQKEQLPKKEKKNKSENKIDKSKVNTEKEVEEKINRLKEESREIL